MSDKESPLNAKPNYLIMKYNECLSELNRLTNPTELEKLLQKLTPSNEFALLDISKRIRNLLKVGYKDGRERADQFTAEGRRYYTNLQNQRFSEHAGRSLENSKFLNHVRWHRIKVKEYIDELKLYSEIFSTDQTNETIETSLDIDSLHDSFQGIMKVFISHKIEKENQKLAVTLRNSLRGKEISGYIAEGKFELELLIDEKIRKEIESSDYVIGIITKESVKSASVNQELGYAMGLGIPVLLMVEKGVSHGVLTHGRDVIEFTRESFEKSCSYLIKYILENIAGKKIKKHTHGSDDFDILLDKFTENGTNFVGIRNLRGKSIKSCSILCAQQKCDWWDTHEPHPRNIAEGEGGNVVLPRGFANINPVITIMVGNDIIEQTRLNEIARRTSTKWLGLDEDEERVERLSIALNRIISNLGYLHSLFQIFLNHKKGVLTDDQVKLYLTEKNKTVENLQTITNQASDLLEMDWMNDINDLCALAKNNPWMLDGKVQILQCEHCSGIISQIESILKRLPNPPI